MRVRIIASRQDDNIPDITELIGQEFEVLSEGKDYILVKTDFAPLGYQIFTGEYEVVEQKEAPGAVTPCRSRKGKYSF